MKRNEPVTRIMTPNPVTVHRGMRVSDVRRILAEGRFHHLPVVDGPKLVGIISSTDLLRLQWGMDDERGLDSLLDHFKAIPEVMSVPDTITPKTTIRRAVEILAEGRFNALPVVSDQNLVGIVTTRDVLRYLLEEAG